MIDLSKHELKITKHPNITVYEFKRPDTIVCGITIIVGYGVTSVTGDFGNWIFSREFNLTPSDKNDTKVSRSYLDEKLSMYSSQKIYEYNPEKTVKLIDDFKNDWLHDESDTDNEELKDWIESLYYHSDDETEYKYVAYREKPSNIDYEYVPYGEVRNAQLEIIYDIFDEILRRNSIPNMV